MRDSMDDRLLERIDKDLTAMAEERKRLLMQSGELEGVRDPEKMLADIQKGVAARRRMGRRLRIRRRAAGMAALVAVLCIGAGVISSGSKVYVPEIFQQERQDGVTTKANNGEVIARPEDEEEIYREIEEKLGVFPVRLGYRLEGMELTRYQIEEDVNEVYLIYEMDEDELCIYISKDYHDASISHQVDGEKLDSLPLTMPGWEVEIFKYDTSREDAYFSTSFEYLNTYYSITGRMAQAEFEKIIKNIVINNV